MAERLNKRQADSARQLIQVQNIVRNLERCQDGEFEMNSNQIAAARILLDKSLPSLQSVEATGQIDSNVTISVTLGS